MGKLEKCDESSVQDLESEKEELQKEKDELFKRLADFEEKYNLMETNCKLPVFPQFLKYLSQLEFTLYIWWIDN